MAKFKIEYENRTITKTVEFDGDTFTNKMGDWENGCRQGEKTFDNQYENKYANTENIEEILEALDVLSYSNDDDEIEDALEILSDFE